MRGLPSTQQRHRIPSGRSRSAADQSVLGTALGQPTPPSCQNSTGEARYSGLSVRIRDRSPEASSVAYRPRHLQQHDKLHWWHRVLPAHRLLLMSLGLLLVVSAISAGWSGNLRSQKEWQGFRTLPLGAALPTGRECAERVRRSPWEPRSENAKANHTIPANVRLSDWSGFADSANRLLKPRIDGAFTGTTDEILLWASCKWGIDTEVARAMAVQESNWVQDSKGDHASDPSRCLPGDAVPCPVSFGLLQIKYYYHPGTYPASLQSTAFNVDYSLGLLRACYEGLISHLDNGYGAGDLWACVGHHFSGGWRDPDAMEYAGKVQRLHTTKPWRTWSG